MRFVYLRFHLSDQRSQSLWILSRPPSEFNFDTRLRNIITINGRREWERWLSLVRSKAYSSGNKCPTTSNDGSNSSARASWNLSNGSSPRGKKVGINGGRVQYENKTLLKKPPRWPDVALSGQWKMLPATKPLRDIRLEDFAMLSRGSRENWAVPSTHSLIVSLSPMF